MPAFAKLRRRIADFILGDQTVLFSSRTAIKAMEDNRHLDLTDEQLGVATRRWFAGIGEATAGRALEENKPFSVMMTQQSVLYIANYAMKVKADTATFVIRGSVDGGRTERVFKVEFSLLPDDYDFGPKGVHEKHGDPEKPEAITELRISYDNPGYDEWKASKAA